MSTKATPLPTGYTVARNPYLGWDVILNGKILASRTTRREAKEMARSHSNRSAA